MDDFKPQQQTPPHQPDEPQGFNQSNQDNEPETYVTPEGQPTTLGETHIEPQAPAVVVAPKKSGAKKWIVGGVFVLLLAGLGALAYWQFNEAALARQQVSDLQNQYDDLSAQYKKIEEPLDTSNGANDDGATASSSTLEDRATTAAKALAAATLSATDVARVDKISGEFVVLYTGQPNKDGVPHIFKNTPEALIEIAILDNGLSKTESDRLKSEYGLDTSTLGLTVTN